MMRRCGDAALTDGFAGRGFERSTLMSLALSRWVEDGQAILVTGATG